jgi:diguanylate cyclase (GGDEF)-like protein
MSDASDDVYENLRKTGKQLMLFNEIAKALTSTLEPNEVLRMIMQQVSSLIQPSSWSLLLEDSRTGNLYFEIAVGAGADRLKGLRLHPSEGIAGQAFTTGEVQVVHNVKSSPMHARRFDQISETETQNVVAIPLKVRGRVLGVLEMVNGLTPQTKLEDLQALRAIADYAAIAMENARNFQRVQELIIKDEHTGLYNVRHLRALLEQEVARAARFDRPISLVFIDLDRFKAINDEHGHMYGSELLGEVGDVLLNSIRKIDAAFRYGGDEFALLLVETRVQGALTLARRIRDRFHEREFLKRHKLHVKLTASFGVATFPDHASSAADLLHAADQAMYRAKALGRDEVASTADLLVARPPPK